jgi:UDP-2,3-diacylglucosamine pyrophosphatase LpxH
MMLISGVAISQSEAEFFKAFKNADIQAMDPYMVENVDFCIFEDQQLLAKKVALTKLKTFLSTYKISAVDVIHQGTSKDKKTQYKVAKVTTNKETFRVFVYVVGDFKTGSVKEIRIDKF